MSVGRVVFPILYKLPKPESVGKPVFDISFLLTVARTGIIEPRARTFELPLLAMPSTSLFFGLGPRAYAVGFRSALSLPSRRGYPGCLAAGFNHSSSYGIWRQGHGKGDEYPARGLAASLHWAIYIMLCFGGFDKRIQLSFHWNPMLVLNGIFNSKVSSKWNHIHPSCRACPITL